MQKTLIFHIYKRLRCTVWTTVPDIRITRYNIGIEQSGSAIVFRDDITLTNNDTQVDGPWWDGLTMLC
jgi:hypothetical protein